MASAPAAEAVGLAEVQEFLGAGCLLPFFIAEASPGFAQADPFGFLFGLGEVIAFKGYEAVS